MVILPDVLPSIVLSSFLESSFPVKVVSQPRAPHERERHDDPLSLRDLNYFAVMLMEKVVGLVENGQNGPDAVDPRHLAGDLSQHEAKSPKSQRKSHSVLHRSLIAVLQERKGSEIGGDLFEFLHLLIILLNQPKLTRNQYYPLPPSLPSTYFLEQYSYCMKQSDNSKTRRARDKVLDVAGLKDDSFSELSRSQYSLKDVLNLQEFKELSKEIHLQQRQEEKLIDSFYYPTWKEHQLHFERTENPQSLYESQYRKWKGEESKKADNFKSTYESTLALIDKEKQKQEVNRLIKEYSLDNALFSYSQKNDTLTQIKKQYAESLQNIIKAQPKIEVKHIQHRRDEEINPIQVVERQRMREREENKQKLIELEVQKQLLQRIKKIDEKERQQELKAKKQRQLKKSCFVELIRRPPVKNTQREPIKKQEKYEENHSNVIPLSYIQKENNIQVISSHQSSEKKARYRLNVQQILKMPHRLFLIFYSQNYNQIVRLSSPQDLKRLNSYRDQAIKRQQAVQKLKKKVSQQGPEMIAKLPSQMKQKLFKILYEGDLQQQAFYQSK